MSTKYVSNGNPNMLVWNPETKALLCQFSDGVFETDDKNAIRVLDTLAAKEENPRVSRADGTKTKKAVLVEPPTPPEDMSEKQLKAYAKENDIELPKNAKTKVAILAFLAEAE